MSANRVHVTYTRPVSLSAAIHTLSLKNVVGTALPAASAPSICTIVGELQCRPPSWETFSVMALGASVPPGAGANRLNAMFA